MLEIFEGIDVLKLPKGVGGGNTSNGVIMSIREGVGEGFGGR